MNVKIIAGLVGILFLVAACSQNNYEGMSFQQVCAQTGGMWMKMYPTNNGIPTGQPACSGCMQPRGDHICEKERYLGSLGGK